MSMESVKMKMGPTLALLLMLAATSSAMPIAHSSPMLLEPSPIGAHMLMGSCWVRESVWGVGLGSGWPG